MFRGRTVTADLAREKRSAAAGAATTTLLPGRCTRNVVYYQNRFIVIDSAPAVASTTTTTTAGAATAHTSSLTSPVNHKARGGALRSCAVGGLGGGVGGGGGGCGSSPSLVQGGWLGRGWGWGLEAASDRWRRGEPAACDVTAPTASSGSSSSNPTRTTCRGLAPAKARISATDDNNTTTGSLQQQQASAVNTSSSGSGGGGGVRRSGGSSSRRGCGGGGGHNMDALPSATTVDGRGIEIIVSDETGISHRPDKPSRLLSGKRAAALKRVGTVLLDNRMKGRENCQHLLMEHPEEYRVLKRVLNIMFVTVGVALLISVFVVIVYTAVVGEKDKNHGSSTKEDIPTLPSNTTQSPNTTHFHKQTAV